MKGLRVPTEFILFFGHVEPFRNNCEMTSFRAQFCFLSQLRRSSNITFEYSFLNNLYKLTSCLDCISFIHAIYDFKYQEFTSQQDAGEGKVPPLCELRVLTSWKGPALELGMESLLQRIGKWAWLM